MKKNPGRFCALLLVLLMLPSAALADLQARFIDVGQGDSCLITCDGESMMIDGGTDDNGDMLVSLLNGWGIDGLKYMVNTHPHNDHVGGLVKTLRALDVDSVYSSVTDYNKNDFVDFKEVINDKGMTLKTLAAGDTLELGGARIDVLGPVNISGDLNNDSIVLKVIYGDTSMLLTGDAGQQEERTIIDSGADLQSTLLKVGHHGSTTSTTVEFLNYVLPTYSVISVGVDNDYNHPSPDVIGRLSDMGSLIFRTDIHGTINVVSDGKYLSLSTGKGVNPIDVKDEAGGTEYIGNKNSKKFHLPSCYTLPAEKNRVYFDTRDEAVNAGYDPCKNCDP